MYPQNSSSLMFLYMYPPVLFWYIRLFFTVTEVIGYIDSVSIEYLLSAYSVEMYDGVS